PMNPFGPPGSGGGGGGGGPGSGGGPSQGVGPLARPAYQNELLGMPSRTPASWKTAAGGGWQANPGMAGIYGSQVMTDQMGNVIGSTRDIAKGRGGPMPFTVENGMRVGVGMEPRTYEGMPATPEAAKPLQQMQIAGGTFSPMDIFGMFGVGAGPQIGSGLTPAQISAMATPYLPGVHQR